MSKAPASVSNDFDLLDAPLHWITVEWSVLAPGATPDDLSVEAKVSIDVRVELVERAEALELFPAMFGERDGEGEDAPFKKPKLGEVDLLERLIKDWRRFKAGGSPVPYGREGIEKLLKVPMFGGAFAQAYVAALGGRRLVREGN